MYAVIRLQRMQWHSGLVLVLYNCKRWAVKNSRLHTDITVIKATFSKAGWCNCSFNVGGRNHCVIFFSYRFLKMLIEGAVWGKLIPLINDSCSALKGWGKTKHQVCRWISWRCRYRKCSPNLFVGKTTKACHLASLCTRNQLRISEQVCILCHLGLS